MLSLLINQIITPYMPVIDRGHQCDAFFTRDAFSYDRKIDAYRCPADSCSVAVAPTSNLGPYQSRPIDCAACELERQCTTSSVSPPKRALA